MKTLALLLLSAAAGAPQTATQDPKVFHATNPPNALGPISKETLLALQLIEAKEQPMLDAAKKLFDAAFKQFNDQRNVAVQAECAKYKLDASKGQCYLDTTTGQVKRAESSMSDIKVTSEPTVKQPNEGSGKK